MRRQKCCRMPLGEGLVKGTPHPVQGELLNISSIIIILLPSSSFLFKIFSCNMMVCPVSLIIRHHKHKIKIIIFLFLQCNGLPNISDIIIAAHCHHLPSLSGQSIVFEKTNKQDPPPPPVWVPFPQTFDPVKVFPFFSEKGILLKLTLCHPHGAIYRLQPQPDGRLV